ncbi:MAG: SET domain-containing protein-lysine N-methyltransferase [Patescibacteria group bacterium]
MRQFEIVIKKSKINNFGAFAVTDISENSFLIEYIGEKISNEESQKREIINDKEGVTYIFCLDEQNFIDGAIGGNESRFINHSCNPNCKIVRKKGKIFFYSKRKIKKGEELTIDYAYDKNSKKEICNCGSENCRGFINELE